MLQIAGQRELGEMAHHLAVDRQPLLHLSPRSSELKWSSSSRSFRTYRRMKYCFPYFSLYLPSRRHLPQL